MTSSTTHGAPAPESPSLTARKAFLELGERDARLLRDLSEAMARVRPRIVDRLYERLLASPETRPLLERTDLATLRQRQGRYFDSLFEGTYDEAYAKDRQRIGETHFRLGVKPSWYLGTYALYVRLVVEELEGLTGGDWERAIPILNAFVKVAFLDMTLALETYEAAHVGHIHDLKRLNDLIVASVPAGLVLADAGLRVLAANRPLLGPREEPRPSIVGASVMEVLGIPELAPHLEAALGSGRPASGLLFTAAGGGVPAPRPVRVAITAVEPLAAEQVERLLVVVEDLSEEERLAATARASEERFHRVVESASDGIVLTNERGLITYFNRAAEQMFGWRREEVWGRPLELLLPEAERARHASAVRGAGESPEAMCGVRAVHGRRKDGTSFPAECAVSLHGEGEQLGYTAVLRDVSARHASEEALRRSEASFRALIEHSPDAVAVVRQGRFVYVNPSLLALLGHEKPEALLGQPAVLLAVPDEREPMAHYLRQLEEQPTTQPAVERRWVRRDGSTVDVEITTLPVIFDGQPAVAGVARDLGARRQLAAKMMQMDRMIAVGTMAAGVGHEINNPLCYVLGNLGFLGEQLRRLFAELGRGSADAPDAARPTAPRLHEDATWIAEVEGALREAQEGAERVRTIVRDLKTFARSDQEVRAPVHVERVLASAINMAWTEIRHRARLVQEISPTPPVLANESRLGQVFLNLLVNAAQAIPEDRSDDHCIRVRTSLRASQVAQVAIEVHDTGAGIAPEHLARIFDPFFTTKPMGQGTGLGLSICQGLVQAMGGQIEVESQLGRGSCFRVLLPAALEPVEATEATADAEPSRRRAPRSRVLIVDDEPLVAQSLERTLRDLHEVESVTTAQAALRHLAEGKRYDLILCDLMLPQMSGIDLYQELLARAPELAERMLFITGGAFTPRARQFLEESRRPWLEKPLGPEQLRRFVAEHLEKLAARPTAR
ncbi:MAG: PAS domain S-box protein [Deltaproteobacteria bacterium]|nr:PAS domain S-box protein [Deltaproteobacteria bacterium]